LKLAKTVALIPEGKGIISWLILAALSVRYWPILLKKSAMVSTTEKYALKIEIFTLNRGLWTQISRSCALKRRFQQSVCGQSGRTDFFNRIGRLLPVTTAEIGPERALFPT
jgi:hypothetical protein